MKKVVRKLWAPVSAGLLVLALVACEPPGEKREPTGTFEFVPNAGTPSPWSK